MVTFTQFVTVFYDQWMSIFQDLPYGDPYIGWAVLAAISLTFAWALKLIFDKEA